MGEMKSVYKMSVGKPEEKQPLKRPRHGWEDNIRMDPREIGWEDVDLFHLAQDMEKSSPPPLALCEGSECHCPVCR
jgi:hypothetical protein